jgi:hypothetical protein
MSALKASGGAVGGGSETLTVNRHIVRRLTPKEAERLMSLPDDYTKYGHDGKEMSDTARYRMCGNSIVIHVLAPIMQNVAAALSKEKEGDDARRLTRARRSMEKERRMWSEACAASERDKKTRERRQESAADVA